MTKTTCEETCRNRDDHAPHCPRNEPENDISKVRLNRVEKDIFDIMTQLTKVRTTRPAEPKGVREVATRLNLAVDHLWQIANDMGGESKIGDDG